MPQELFSEDADLFNGLVGPQEQVRISPAPACLAAWQQLVYPRTPPADT